MTPNGLSERALAAGARSAGALAAGALSAGSMSASALTTLQDPGAAGELSREFARYAVDCALADDQHFTFTWTDASGAAHQEDYRGRLGLAPAWATGSLGEEGQRRVSACLAARTNRYGQRVMLSARGLAQGQPGRDERASFPHEEGAFWGNVFAATPALYACHDNDNVDHSRAYLRDCAAGHLEPDGTTADCGIIHVLGPCEQFCAPVVDPGLGHIYCSADPSTLSRPEENVYVISVYLP